MIRRYGFAAFASLGILLSAGSAAAVAERIAPAEEGGTSAGDASPTLAPLRNPSISLARSSDSGVSHSDGITREKELVFTGVAKPNSTVVITERSIGLASGKATKEGRYEITLRKQSEGRHTYAAAQLIKPGVGYFSREITVTIDTEAPRSPSLDLSRRTRLFENGQAVITGQAEDRDVRIRVYEGRKLLGEASPGDQGGWSTGRIAVSRGTHVVHAVALDRAGNASVPSEAALILMDIRRREFSLADLDQRSGLLLRGKEYSGEVGFSVAGVGDVNGDGFDDVAIGAPAEGPYSPGRTYILFGSTTPFPQEIRLPSLAGRFGVSLDGGRDDKMAGTKISAAGDVNEDGIADVLVGAPYSSKVYLVFGRKVWPETVKLGRMKVGEGVMLVGTPRTCFGGALSGGGDVDGDGIDDIAVGCGAHRPDSFSEAGVYIVFGRSTGFPRILTAAHMNGSYGVRLTAEGENLGFSLTIQSDLNNDRIDDVVVSQPEHRQQNPDNLGRVHVLFGSSSRFRSTTNLNDISPGKGFNFTGDLDTKAFGSNKIGSLAGGADLNSDGIDDLAVTLESRGRARNRTAGFILFGRRDFGKSPLALAKLDGDDGFRVDFGHAGERYTGASLNFAGDVDGDGKADLISTFSLENLGAGSAIILYGRRTFPPVLPLEGLGREEGRFIHGIDRGGHSGANGDSGLTTAGAGDINADGVDDIVMGAPYAGRTQHPPGLAYIVFGRAER